MLSKASGICPSDGQQNRPLADGQVWDRLTVRLVGASRMQPIHGWHGTRNARGSFSLPSTADCFDRTAKKLAEHAAEICLADRHGDGLYGVAA